MKKLLFLLLPVVFAFKSNEYVCDEKGLKTDAFKMLGEFAYSSSKTTNLYFVNNNQVKEIEVNLFEGELYRIIFNNKSLPEKVAIEVYDKPKDNKFRKLLFTSETAPSTEMVVYEPSWRHRNIYIDYLIPATADEEVKKGCAIFIVGYKLDF